MRNVMNWDCTPESIRILEKALRYALWRLVDREAFEGQQLNGTKGNEKEEKRK